MRVSKLTALFSLVALSSVARAEMVTLPITSVTTHQNGCARLNFAAGNFNSAGVLVFDGTSAGGKAMLATAMLAISNGKTISVNRVTVGGSSGCWGINDQVSEVTINP